MTESNIEIGIVQDVEGQKVFRVLSAGEVKDYLTEVQ